MAACEVVFLRNPIHPSFFIWKATKRASKERVTLDNVEAKDLIDITVVTSPQPG